jgi:hypothetical protein
VLNLPEEEISMEKLLNGIDFPEEHIIEALRFLNDNKQIRIKDNKIKKL